MLRVVPAVDRRETKYTPAARSRLVQDDDLAGPRCAQTAHEVDTAPQMADAVAARFQLGGHATAGVD